MLLSPSYPHAGVRIIQDLQPFLETAGQAAPDLLLVYLYLADPEHEAVGIPTACRAEIEALLAEAAGQPCSIMACGLSLVPYLRSEFKIPVIVMTGCPPRPGLATRVEQAGAAAFLRVPFTPDQCAAALSASIGATLSALGRGAGGEVSPP